MRILMILMEVSEPVIRGIGFSGRRMDWINNDRELSDYAGLMVAREGVEPPTPAFSVLRYAVF